jgi:hypothetical protein
LTAASIRYIRNAQDIKFRSKSPTGRYGLGDIPLSTTVTLNCPGI